MVDWYFLAPIVAVVAIVVCMAYALYKRRFMTFSIMFSCIIVFILQMTTVPSVYYPPWLSSTALNLGYSPHYIIAEPWKLYTLFTSIFVHSGVVHLVFNLLALILIGTIFEDRVGTFKYTIIFFSSGIFAIFFFTIFTTSSNALLIGASGAFSGLLGAFARTYPKEKIRMFLLFILMPPLPMYVVALLFLGLETIFAGMGGFNLVGAITGEGGQIAHSAHIGGFIFGFAIAPWVMKLEFKEPGRPKRKVSVDMEAVRKLAITEKQKEILAKIEKEDEPDVKRAWIEELAKNARCPECGRKLEVTTNRVRCNCGFKLKF